MSRLRAMARPIDCRDAIIGILMLAALAVTSTPQRARAGPPSVEALFGKPQYFGATLSPSGRYLALVAPAGEQRGIRIIDLDTRTAPPTLTVDGGDLLRIVWQNDDRLILYLGDIQSVAGETPRVRGSVAVSRDGSDPRPLARPWVGVSSRSTPRREFQRPWTLELVRVIPGTNEILVTASENTDKGEDLYRYDTSTGAKTLLSFGAPGYVSRWVVDFDNVPRAAVVDDLDRDISAWFVRKSAEDPWIKVEETQFGRLSVVPLQFDPDGKILYVAGRRNGADRASIHEYHVDAARWGAAIISHPERDVYAGNAHFVVDQRLRKLLGLRYASDRPSVEWFDPEWARIQKSVDAALPDTVNEIQGGTDAKRWIVVAHSDRNPGDVYLLDAKTMRMEKLFAYMAGIEPKAMSATRWIRYRARDGLTIPALLTAPAGANGKPVPLVVDIHGGPYIEANTWGYYNREVQFFASRGYAVLQPQFRGTSGFGWKHQSSGYRQWGEAMQDDLEDGVKWAIAQGIADPSRVCFYGGSYGGYAAIWGTIRNGALIKCAVAAVAVTSIDYLFDNAQTDIAYFIDKTTLEAYRIGDPKTERARFKRISPLDNADKVAVPILLAYGGGDVRVPIVHGTDFRAALDREHKEYEWVQYAEEGHGFNRDANVFDYYGRVERFLAKYLRSEPVGQPPAGVAPQ